MNNSFVLKLNVRDENIDITHHVTKQIPFFETLVSATNVMETQEPVTLDISPSFLRTIIDYVINDKSLDYLKKKLSEYDTDTIKTWLMYLGMDQLIRKLDPIKNNIPVKIENKRIVVSLEVVVDPNICISKDIGTFAKSVIESGNSNLIGVYKRLILKMADGTYIANTTSDMLKDMLYLVDAKLATLDGNQFLFVKTISNETCAIPLSYPIQYDGLFFLSLEDFIRLEYWKDLAVGTK